MSWNGSLRAQIAADFREVARSRDVVETSDERPPVELLATPVVEVITARSRRVVRREARG